MSLSAGKTLFGVSMLAFGGWSFAGSVLNEKAFDGIVSAPTVIMYAPISGTLELSLEENAVVAPGDLIAQIVPGEERSATGGMLQNDRAFALRNQIKTLQAVASDLESNVNSYARSRTSYLEAQAEQMSAIYDALVVKVEQQEKTVARSQALARTGHISSAELENQQTDLLGLRLDQRSAAAKLRSAQVELAAARDGTFIGEGYNDVPFSSQRKVDVELRIVDLERELGEMGDSSTQVAEAKPVTADIKSPVGGRLWQLNYAEGQYIGTGSAIAQVANCKRLTTEVELPAQYFDMLTEGSTALLQLNGSSQRVGGRVNRLIAKTSNAADGGLARTGAVASGTTLYIASIDLDAEAFGGGCPVGRHMSVVFKTDDTPLRDQLATLSQQYASSLTDLYERVSSLVSSRMSTFAPVDDRLADERHAVVPASVDGLRTASMTIASATAVHD